jgi:nucleotide sugar dehydrogenase
MHFPGAGVGGHCLPKDPWLLKYGVDNYGKFKVEPNVIVHSRNLNTYMPMHTADLVEEALNQSGEDIKNAKITILGVAFLENSDDTRNTPAKDLFEILEKKGVKPILHDPYVRDFEIPFTKDIDEAVNDSDAIVIVTKHKDYFDLDFNDIKEKMRTRIIVDGRNMFDKNKIESLGFIYKGVGKPH